MEESGESSALGTSCLKVDHKRNMECSSFAFNDVNPLFVPAGSTRCLCVCAQWLSHVRLFATPWTIACLAPLSLGFPEPEYWSGLPFPTQGSNSHLLVSSALAIVLFTTEPPGKPVV